MPRKGCARAKQRSLSLCAIDFCLVLRLGVEVSTMSRSHQDARRSFYLNDMQRLLREGRYQQCIAAIRIDDPFSAANNELVELEFIQDDADVKDRVGAHCIRENVSAQSICNSREKTGS